MNRILELFSAGTLFIAIALAFVLGAAPVFAVRLIARIYPKGDDRRAELVAEAAHVKGLGKTFELWRWLGESFAVALCEGWPERRRRRRLTVRVGRQTYSIVRHAQGDGFPAIYVFCTVGNSPQLSWPREVARVRLVRRQPWGRRDWSGRIFGPPYARVDLASGVRVDLPLPPLAIRGMQPHEEMFIA